MTGPLTIADHWQRHRGEVATILACGPSLTTTELPPGGIVLGAHSVAWSPLRDRLDYWLCIDTEPAQVCAGVLTQKPCGPREGWDGGTPRCHHIIRTGIMGASWQHKVVSPHGRTMITTVGGQQSITPHMVTAEWCRPQAETRRKAKPVTGGLFAAGSSTIPAIHLAMLWGVAEIVLVGCDCGGPIMNWDDPTVFAYEDRRTRTKLGNMRTLRRWLEKFAQMWGGTYRLRNLSQHWHDEGSAGWTR